MKFRLTIHIIFIFILNFSVETLFAQSSKNLYVAKRIFEAPDIDGYIEEEAWDMAEADSIDIQYSPYNGKKSSKKSEFRILYDDKAIYIAAVLFDNPDSIRYGLGRRDDAFDMNADQFIADIGPYDDGINSFSFMVSSSGVQSDFKNYFNTRDLGWDAVWKSRTRIVARGWLVEIKIPYSAIRFSENIFQVWSLNIFRLIKRKEETSSWNLIDREIVGITNQSGQLIGIENINSPFRLSVSPWVSANVEKMAESNKWVDYYKAGIDLKYGINQAFTLDASLFPDFTQVPFDDVVLNLSPFETKYDEHRQFFSEGAEMFSKANIFYSRRIGLIPDKFSSIENDLDTNEIIVENPGKLDIINAIKLTGRTSKKVGFGIVNTMTRPGFATFEDTLADAQRNVETQSFTNYNVIAFDKSLKNNSFISLINTNLTKDKASYISNVTGTEFKFSNSENSYAISGIGALSQLYDTINGNEMGFKSNFYIDKTSGKFLFRIGNEIISENYDQNKMGYLPFVNEITNLAKFEYNIYQPFWVLLSLKNFIELKYSTLFNPVSFTDFRTSVSTEALFTNQFSVNLSGFVRPFGNHDYYEARTEGQVFIKAPSYSGFIKVVSDPRKTLSASVFYKYWGNTAKIGMVWNTIGVSPYLRIQSRFQLGLDLFYDKFNNSIGYVQTINDTIYMGKRNLETYSNTLSFIYSFTNKAWINLKVRHYWSTAIHNKYYILKENGKLEGTDNYPYNADIDFQMLNLDFAFKWEFSPGSLLSITWKNLFSNKGLPYTNDYFETLSNMYEGLAYNNFSIRLLYYLDFLYLKKNGN